MRERLRVPSNVSAVVQSPDILRFVSGNREIASVSATPLGDLLRIAVSGASTVARGDLLSPVFRRDLATDIRLCYSSRRTDRTDLLRLFNECAVAWDAHRSGSTFGDAP